MSHVPYLDEEIQRAEDHLADLKARRDRAEDHLCRPFRPCPPRTPEVMTVDDYRRLWVAARSFSDPDGWRRRIEQKARQLQDAA